MLWSEIGLHASAFGYRLPNMTDPLPQGALDSQPHHPFDVHGRMAGEEAPWPMRAWILAAIGAVAALLFYAVVEHGDTWLGERIAAAIGAFLVVATVSLLLGVERRRWTWAVIFSAFWGLIAGLVFWQVMVAADGPAPAPFFWPFASVVVAILIATPFFQTWRDVAESGRQWKLWQLPYRRLHDHAWIDAVIGAAAMLFAVISCLLMLLIGGMFDMIGIKFFSRLMNNAWFVMPLVGGAFGGAVGLLRERDRLVAVMQRLVMTVLAVLAPVLAAAVLLFLVSMVGTGLKTLWSQGFSASYLLLTVAAAALLLANAVIGNGDEADGAGHVVMRWSAAVLAVVVVPLALLSMIGIALRVGQYGWTPDRLWGAVAVAVALAYGAAGLWSVLRGRGGFDDILRGWQKKLAAAVMVLAFLLAMPLLDFGAISTRDQVARLESGAVSSAEFDWGALAFEFGPSGRAALTRISRSDNAEWAKAAEGALAAQSRYNVERVAAAAKAKPFEQRVRILPQDAVVPQGVSARVDELTGCASAYACALYVLEPDHVVVLIQREKASAVQQQELVRNAAGKWNNPEWMPNEPKPGDIPDLKSAQVELRSVERRQLRVDGAAQPVLHQGDE